MKKRLRKKLRRGEFTEYGFGLNLDFVPGISVEEVEDFMVHLSDDILGPFGLDVGGGGSIIGFGGYITRHRSSCTEEDRLRVSASLSGHPGVAQLYVGPLTDAWHRWR